MLYKIPIMGRNVEFNETETIEKAMNVFWEKGYHGTSMQDLVDAMQINRSSLYNTIGDKHCLFLKCISSYADQVILEARQKAAKEKSAFKALTNIIRDKAEWVVDCEKGCLGVKTVFEIAPEDAKVREVLSRNNEIFYEFLTELVEKSIVEGEMTDTEDPALIAEYIMTTFTGWKQAFILHGNPIKIKKMAEFLIKSISK